MRKTNDTLRKPRTHFEQVPLEVVKKTAGEGVPQDKKGGTDTVRGVPRSKKGKSRNAPARSLDGRGR